MPRGKAGSDLAKPEARYQWLDLPRLPLLRILEIVHAGSSVSTADGVDVMELLRVAAPLAAVTAASTACTLPPFPPPVNPSGAQSVSSLAKATKRQPPSHWLCCLQLQNPACVCRAWHTAAHEIRLGDTASSRPVRYGVMQQTCVACPRNQRRLLNISVFARRLAISQGSGQQAQTLQTCAGICVAEGASSGEADIPALVAWFCLLPLCAACPLIHMLGGVGSLVWTHRHVLCRV